MPRARCCVRSTLRPGPLQSSSGSPCSLRWSHGWKPRRAHRPGTARRPDIKSGFAGDAVLVAVKAVLIDPDHTEVLDRDVRAVQVIADHGDTSAAVVRIAARPRRCCGKDRDRCRRHGRACGLRCSGGGRRDGRWRNRSGGGRYGCRLRGWRRRCGLLCFGGTGDRLSGRTRGHSRRAHDASGCGCRLWLVCGFFGGSPAIHEGQCNELRVE